MGPGTRERVGERQRAKKTVQPDRHNFFAGFGHYYLCKAGPFVVGVG